LKVGLSKLADRDLGDIYRYSFERFGEALADRYYASLWRCFHFLAEHPTIGRIRTEF
jgi:plasmid stabilization system protein ParE